MVRLGSVGQRRPEEVPRRTSPSLDQVQNKSSPIFSLNAEHGVTVIDRADEVAARNRLGELLVVHEGLTRERLDASLDVQQREPGLLGDVLIRLGYASPAAVRSALCRQRGIAAIDVAGANPSVEALETLPAEAVVKHRMLPVAISDDDELVLAMADPLDAEGVDAARALSGMRVSTRLADEAALVEAIGRHYGSHAERLIANLGPDVVAAEGAEPVDLASHLQELAREPTVVNLVNLLILEAIEARASDIHIEPFEHELKVRYRIDGLLLEMKPPPRHLRDALASRIKIMAGMNIAERFVPQDGHIDFQSPRGKVDLRVATVPTIFGESIVLRILDRTASLLRLDNIGLDAKRLAALKRTLDSPHGIALVTGPTGSGKTTTLYAALQHIYSPERKIITIEDPVEYQLPGVNQIPVNRKRGLGFADGLRAILRQDPDVVMIGEIRDRETADIAIRAALTGHLVFSTLHTNDAAGAVTRLIDMGVEPYLIASSLRAVLGQRLVRSICEVCRQPHSPNEATLERLGHHAEGLTFYRGQGCRACRDIGYRGRAGVFELVVVNDAVRDAIANRASASQITSLLGEDYLPMVEDGYRKASEGLTTLEEVFRVTQE